MSFSASGANSLVINCFCCYLGPVVVVGIREGSLWLVDAQGQPFVVPVNHPGLKARCLSAQGDSQAARLLAERGLSCCLCGALMAFLYSCQAMPRNSMHLHCIVIWLSS